MVDTHELAWAAGFFDGEGNIRFREPVRRKTDVGLVLTINQSKSPELLHRFQRAVGIGTVAGPYSQGWSPFWKYTARGFQSPQYVIALIWKWIGTPKREQAKAACLKARAHYNRPKKGHSRGGFHYRMTHVGKK